MHSDSAREGGSTVVLPKLSYLETIASPDLNFVPPES